MPTSDGRRSVADAEAQGKPLMEASGIKRKVWHRFSCRPYSACTCGLSARLSRLAFDMADLMQDYPDPILKGRSDQ